MLPSDWPMGKPVMGKPVMGKPVVGKPMVQLLD